MLTTNLLADRFYLLAHAESTGRPLLPERVAGLGAAAAILGELLLGGQLLIRDNGVVEPQSRNFDGRPPHDVLSAWTLVQVQHEVALYPLRDWLVFFGPGAMGRIARRLSSEGLVARRASRIPLRSGCWAATDRHIPAIVCAGLVTDLVRGRPMSEDSVILAGLARASGLERDHPALRELRDHPAAQRYLDARLAALSPQARELVGGTEAAIAASIAAHRV